MAGCSQEIGVMKIKIQVVWVFAETIPLPGKKRWPMAHCWLSSFHNESFQMKETLPV